MFFLYISYVPDEISWPIPQIQSANTQTTLNIFFSFSTKAPCIFFFRPRRAHELILINVTLVHAIGVVSYFSFGALYHFSLPRSVIFYFDRKSFGTTAEKQAK